MTNKEKPHGKEEVSQAVLEAAAELFAQHGMAGVSIRDIAARAGINHGLIHRHFKSKQNLRKQVQEMLAARVRSDMGPGRTFTRSVKEAARAAGENPAFIRFLARTLLDGGLEGPVQDSFPFVRQAVETAEKDQESGALNPDMDPRVLAAGILAMGFGLEVFEDYLFPATGLDNMPGTQAKEAVFSAWLRLVEARGACPRD